MEWTADLHEVDGIRKWYGKQPKLVRIACSRMLNEFAFGTRTRAIERIGRTMIVRNRRFVASRLRVTKANGYAPVNRQAAWAGSVAIPRGTKGHGPFTGWVEQEFGGNDTRNRFSTLAGRGGSEQKQMRHAIRLKPGREVITAENAGYDQRGGAGNVRGFIAMVMRKKETRLIRIKGGIYKRNRKKLDLVQEFGKRRTRRNRWMRSARAEYFRHTDLVALWGRIVRPLMGVPGK